MSRVQLYKTVGTVVFCAGAGILISLFILIMFFGVQIPKDVGVGLCFLAFLCFLFGILRLYQVREGYMK